MIGVQILNQTLQMILIKTKIIPVSNEININFNDDDDDIKTDLNERNISNVAFTSNCVETIN